MKNKFFTHNFLPILSVFLFVIFIFFTNVKASSDKKTIYYKGSYYSLPSECTDNYLLVEYNNRLVLAFGDTSYWGVFESGGDYYLYNYSNDSSYGTMNYRLNYHCYEYNLDITDFSSPYEKNLDIWGIIGKVSSGLSGLNIHYSSVDIYDPSGNVFYKGKNHTYNYNIELSTNYETNGPIVAYSNYFDYSDAKIYKCFISTDASNWTLMNYETFNDTVNNIVKFRFNYKIYENGCYYFKFLNTETNEDYYLSYNITNIIKNSSNSGFTSSGIPQPFCTYERVNNEFFIKTQSFIAEDMQKYRCFYTKNSINDYSSWNEMSMGSFNNILTGETEYYFFFTVPKDSEDCTYYFVFYDNNLNEYGSPSSMNCYFDKMNEYADSLSPIVSEKNNKFNELLNYFKERFGFLTYPFEFLIDFFNRILNINYSEPIIHIPELREPFGNNKIFNGIDFNFNSLLNNSTFSYLYNIYLIAVDFVIVILFIFLCKKVIEEVFTNG